MLGCTGAGWGCFGVWVYYFFSFLELHRGWSPLLASAAWHLLRSQGWLPACSAGLLFSRGIRPHWIMLISMCSFFVGSLIFATAPVDRIYWLNTFFSILIMPFGMDMSNPAATM